MHAHDPQLEARIQTFELFRMQMEAPEAFKVEEKESEATKKL